jgi:hypothetical protein
VLLSTRAFREPNPEDATQMNMRGWLTLSAFFEIIYHWIGRQKSPIIRTQTRFNGVAHLGMDILSGLEQRPFPLLGIKIIHS